MEEKKLEQIEQANEPANENNTEKELWEVLQLTSLEQSQSYFNLVENKTWIPCILVEKWSVDGVVVNIPFWLPSRWIKALMKHLNMPKEISDIVVEWYKNIYLGSRYGPQYDLKIVFWWKNYIISPVDHINLQEVVSEEEKNEWIHYLRNKELCFYMQDDWQYSDIHDEQWPHWWGKIMYADSFYEIKDWYFDRNWWQPNSTPNDIDDNESILMIVPYWTYEWNHDSFPLIIPVDDDLNKQIKIDY